MWTSPAVAATICESASASGVIAIRVGGGMESGRSWCGESTMVTTRNRELDTTEERLATASRKPGI